MNTTTCEAQGGAVCTCLFLILLTLFQQDVCAQHEQSRVDVARHILLAVVTSISEHWVAGVNTDERSARLLCLWGCTRGVYVIDASYSIAGSAPPTNTPF